MTRVDQRALAVEAGLTVAAVLRSVAHNTGPWAKEFRRAAASWEQWATGDAPSDAVSALDAIPTISHQALTARRRKHTEGDE